MKVLVGISGGVDSALTATLLKEQGHDVVCAMMKIYSGDKLTDFANSCYGVNKEQEIKDAKAICEKIGAEFHLIDCSKHFDKLVFEEFRNQYSHGRTPNPCVLCNPRIKFGVFLDLAREKGIEFDKFATGHYARIEEKNGRYLLKTGKNLKKDQSYFLYNLTQAQLSRILFPLGSNTKEKTRELALEKDLIVAKKPDSQDFFKGNYGEILNIPPKKGNIVDSKGNILGEHEGIFNFTIGQRKGLKIAYSEPLYVLNLNDCKNEVLVGTKDETFCSGLIAKNPNWIAFEKLENEIFCTCKIRSAQSPTPCKVRADGDNIIIKFNTPQASVAKGQAVVLYDNDTVLGGATIEEGIK